LIAACFLPPSRNQSGMRANSLHRLLATICFIVGGVATAEAARPNIVFILADDLGINDLGCYGRKEHRTPHLDALAREGVRFTSAYCAQPICSPSRAAILTGKAPARLHLTTYLPGRPDAASQKLLHPVMNQQLPLGEVTLAEALQREGYATACVGKWHLGGQRFLPTAQGFEFYHPGQANTTPGEDEGGKGEYDLTRSAMRFMETNRARPFFLYLPHNSPHIAYTARSNVVARNQAAFESVYAAVIETLDETVGLLLKKLDDLGLRTNTIVVFTSDNGGLHVREGGHARVTHNSPYRAGKGFLYEGGVRIPLIVRWPGQFEPRTTDVPVINTDWFATVLELIGGAPVQGDGQSFAAVLRTGKAKARTLYWHFPHYTNQGSRPGGAVRDGDWKLIEHYDTGRAELYNLRLDVGETNDLAVTERSRAERMQGMLAAWRRAVGAQTNVPNPDFEPALYKTLYEDTDVSRYEPSRADAAMHERVRLWRRAMNAAVAKEGRQDDSRPSRGQPSVRQERKQSE
jgi:arylsulfatase A